MAYTSLYRAKAVSSESGRLQAYVPQVFGETLITIEDVVGSMPDGQSNGWVLFQAGDPEFPVWLSDRGGGGGGGSGGGDDEVWIGPEDPGGSYELWVDSDEHPPEPTVVSISYTHNQTVPAAVWTINHLMGFNPNVTVIDSGGTTVEGDITYLNLNTVRLTFSGAFSGVAYLS